MDAHITCIISTYKRIDALKCTLQALQLQGHENWTALVIGDCCSAETADTIRDLGDQRIKYYNFPARYGEQSGPNNFGFQLAEGDYLSFLNHDDIMLSDHLEYSLNCMREQNSDFHVGKSTNATRLQYRTDGTVLPVFTETLPEYRDLFYLSLKDPWLFEPSSFYIIKKSYANQIGAWRHSSELWRPPLRDWLMRAWRMGGRFSFGDKITGIRFWTQNARKADKLYAVTTPEHEVMLKRCRNEPPDDIRLSIEQQILEESGTKNPGLKQSIKAVARSMSVPHRKLIATLYLKYGLDSHAIVSRLLFKPRGQVHAELIERRTGESLSSIPDVGRLLENPEKYRVK
jgi:Glycosyl transferase family 2